MIYRSPFLMYGEPGGCSIMKLHWVYDVIKGTDIRNSTSESEQLFLKFSIHTLTSHLHVNCTVDWLSAELKVFPL